MSLEYWKIFYLYINVTNEISGVNADTSRQSGRNRKTLAKKYFPASNNLNDESESCKVQFPKFKYGEIDVSRNLGHFELIANYLLLSTWFHNYLNTFPSFLQTFITPSSQIRFIHFSFSFVVVLIEANLWKAIRHLPQKWIVLDKCFEYLFCCLTEA